MKIYLVRHGETDWNLERRAQGQSNTSLNVTGIRQAEELRDKIKDLDFDICIASPLNRAKQTAEIAVNHRRPIIFDDQIKERHLGNYEGRVVDSWEKLNADPSVETFPALLQRAKTFLDSLKTQYPADHKILLVCHNSIGKALIFNLTNTENPDFSSFHLSNGEIREYDF